MANNRDSVSKIWNRTEVVTHELDVTYDEIVRVYNALYGYENYDPTNNDTLSCWLDTILSNARRKNQREAMPKPKRYKAKKCVRKACKNVTRQI